MYIWQATTICFPAALQTAANLLGLEAFRFGDALTQKFMVLRGEEITTPLTVEQVSPPLPVELSLVVQTHVYIILIKCATEMCMCLIMFQKNKLDISYPARTTTFSLSR